MDANHFSKLCRDCSLVDASLSDIMVDLVYLKSQVQGAKTIGYDQFLSALEGIAEKKDVAVEEVVDQVLAQGKPEDGDSTPLPPSWWNDTLLQSTPEKAAEAARRKMLRRRRAETPAPSLPLLKLGTHTEEQMQKYLNKSRPRSPNTPMDLPSPEMSDGTPSLHQVEDGDDDESEGFEEEEQEGESDGNWRDFSMENVRRTYIGYCLRNLQSMPGNAKEAAVNSGALRYFNGMVMEGEGQGLMDFNAFSRLCRDHCLFNSKFHSGEGDVLFESHKDKNTRRICYSQFLEIMKGMAARKGITEEDIFKQICFGNGPMSKPPPEETQAGEGGRLPIIDGRLTPSYARAIRQVRNNAVGSSVDSAERWRSTSKAPALRRSRSLTNDVCDMLDGFPSRPSTSLAPLVKLDLTREMADKVRRVFANYCALRGQAVPKAGSEAMDGSSFARLCKDCQLVGPLLSIGVVDNVFCRVKEPGSRKIGYQQFLNAVKLIAMEKMVSVGDVVSAIALRHSPLSSCATIPEPLPLQGDQSVPDMAMRTSITLPQQPPVSHLARRFSTSDTSNIAALARDFRAQVLDPASQGALAQAYLHWALSDGQKAAKEAEKLMAVSSSGVFKIRQPDNCLMDNSAFARFCRDMRLLDGPFSAVDLIFAGAKDKAARKISFNQFKAALTAIADRRNDTLTEMVEVVIIPRAVTFYA